MIIISIAKLKFISKTGLKYYSHKIGMYKPIQTTTPHDKCIIIN